MLPKKQFAQLLRGLPADVPDVVVHLAAQAAEDGHPLDHIWQLVHQGNSAIPSPTPQPATSSVDVKAPPTEGMSTPNLGAPKDMANHGANLIAKGITPENWTKLMLGSGVPKEHLGKIRAASEKLLHLHKA